MGKMGEHLLFKLRPIASGNDGHFDDAEKVVQQRRHFGIERRFTFGKCAVQIVTQSAFSLPGISISSTFTAPCGRKVTRSDHRRQEPYVAFSDGISGAAVLHLPRALDADQHARHTRGADGKRRLSAQAPQPEMFTVKEPLALHGRRRFHHGRHQTARALAAKSMQASA